IVLICVAQACLYPGRFRRLGSRVLAWAKSARLQFAGVTVVALAVLALWLVLVSSISSEQNALNVRASAEQYKMSDAFLRVQEVRRCTTELFNPNLDRSLESFRTLNPIHNARYIGCFLLPLLAIGLVRRWSRRDRFLIAVA